MFSTDENNVFIADEIVSNTQIVRADQSQKMNFESLNGSESKNEDSVILTGHKSEMLADPFLQTQEKVPTNISEVVQYIKTNK